MEKWQQRWFEGKMPEEAKALHDRVYTAKTKEEAEDVLTDYAKVLMEHFKFDLREAMKEASKDIGYLGGYLSPGQRHQLEELFDVEHPVFGRMKEKGTPSVMDALAAGFAVGRQRLKEN